MLEAVAGLAGAADTVVTFNGKTFDLPLIETRYLFQRMETPFAGMPHVDMLHASRRLWRADEGDGGGCRLSELERALCAHEREGDVPGFEIPARYFHFVRTGDARPLEGVLEHNRLDLLSLALLTARAAQLLDEGPHAARTAREAHGLGRFYERAGLLADARASFARAAGLEGERLPGDDATRAEALRGFALLARRQRRHEDAAAAWSRVLELRRCPPAILREATEALAVHHEHRLREPGAARAFALRALQYQGSVAGRRAVQHRLERLSRKLGEPALAEFLKG
jgi:tetratricopeptide (TPR) repeat protein